MGTGDWPAAGFPQIDQVVFRKKVVVYLILVSGLYLVKSVRDLNWGA
jgi:hypothetical protein